MKSEGTYIRCFSVGGTEDGCDDKKTEKEANEVVQKLGTKK